jgi:hypothetical protein
MKTGHLTFTIRSIFGKISHKQNNLDVVITLKPDRIPACIIIPATIFFDAK